MITPEVLARFTAAHEHVEQAQADRAFIVAEMRSMLPFRVGDVIKNIRGAKFEVSQVLYTPISTTGIERPHWFVSGVGPLLRKNGTVSFVRTTQAFEINGVDFIV